jgi:hypothetical protein
MMSQLLDSIQGLQSQINNLQDQLGNQDKVIHKKINSLATPMMLTPIKTNTNLTASAKLRKPKLKISSKQFEKINKAFPNLKTKGFFL